MAEQETRRALLAEYAIVGDGATAALIDRDGSVDWMCPGRFDRPAVFCRLLDADRGGRLQVAPAAPFAIARRYVGRSAVLESVVACDSGQMRVVDLMPLGQPGSTLVRRLEGLYGTVPVAVDFAPTFDFARAATRLEPCPGGCRASGGGDTLSLWCRAPFRVEGDRARATFDLAAGQVRWVILSHGAPPPAEETVAAWLDDTLARWERWAAGSTYAGPHAQLVDRAAITLKLLIHAESGAMVAAPTTSLPEAIGGERNWDYRYTWLRDASWVVSALMSLGHHDESMAFLRWVERLELDRRPPAVLYDIDGQAPIEERVLPHLAGYRGSAPVRIGNAAAQQDQHDIFGEVVTAIDLCRQGMPSMRPLEPRLWRIVSALADRAATHWGHPDHGMWEVRDRQRHFVTSVALCWTALDRALAIAARDRLDGPLERWRTERDRIRDLVLTEGFDPGLGAFRRAFGESALDATSLLLPRHGLVAPRDPRMIATVDQVRAQLTSDGLVRRYVEPDGLRGAEGAFAACTFWLVQCLAAQGRLDEAHATFERVARHATNLGLLAEEVDAASGGPLGNFPQAFTHLALVRAAVALADAERDQ